MLWNTQSYTGWGRALSAEGELARPERAAALVRESWRSAEEFNVNPGLWLDALFVRLRRTFA